MCLYHIPDQSFPRHPQLVDVELTVGETQPFLCLLVDQFPQGGTEVKDLHCAVLSAAQVVCLLQRLLSSFVE